MDEHAQRTGTSDPAIPFVDGAFVAAGGDDVGLDRYVEGSRDRCVRLRCSREPANSILWVTTERQLHAAMRESGVDRLPAGGTLLYYTGAAKLWTDHLAFVSSDAGLDGAASRFILDAGVINITDRRRVSGRSGGHHLSQPHGLCRIPLESY